MIKLTKSNKPQVLVDNYTQWSSQYVTYHNSGSGIPESLKGKYREPEIKEQLLIETHGKCAYCESKVAHIYPGDVEHILPKSIFPDKVFLWENLTFSCYICNNNKREYHSTTAPLLNPYVDDPGEHLRAYGPSIFHKNSSIKGEMTVTKLKLNRMPVTERRKDRLESLNHLINLWRSENDPGRKTILEEQIKEEATEEKEFTFIVKQYLLDNCNISI